MVTVVDVGTTGIRASIVEIDGKEHHVLEQLDFPVDLTPTLLNHLHATCRARDRCCKPLDDIIHAAGAYDSDRHARRGHVPRSAKPTTATSCSRTSSVRTTSTWWSSMPPKKRASITKPCSATSTTFLLPNRSVVMLDIGSGATNVGVIDDGKLVDAVEEHFGTVRVLDQMSKLVDDPSFCDHHRPFLLGSCRP